MIGWLIERFAAWRARLEQRRALAAVDCHTLEDVGLNPGSVIAAKLGDDLFMPRRTDD
jgi:uncharacterized protein YjiS (DUF1127 family)